MLRGLGDLKDMGAMMKKVMDLKSEMESVKESLGAEQVEGQSAAGMVRVLMSGKMEVLKVTIEPEALNPPDPAVVEEYVQAALNDALTKVQALIKERMSALTGGLNIPGLL